MNSHFEKFQKHLNLKNIPSIEELELFEKTQKYMKFISWIPGLQMVAICNSLSMYASDTDSDIDLFIVAEQNRMWLVRILITAIFQVLGVRRHGNKVAKRFCLSFFATEKGLDFSGFKIDHDIYLAYWIYYLKLILDKGNTYEILRKLNEPWTGEFFSTVDHYEDEKRWQVFSSPAGGEARRGGSVLHESTKNIFLTFLDTLLQKIFLPGTLRHKAKLGNPYGIIINENMLKFHDNDRREELKKSLI